jgi:hypothetical protein
LRRSPGAAGIELQRHRRAIKLRGSTPFITPGNSMPILNYDVLEKFATYKKEIKKDLEKLKPNVRVDIHVLFRFPFDDKDRPAILLGKLPTPLQEALKAKKMVPKKGKCTLVDDAGTEKLKIVGGIPAAKIVEVLKAVAAPVQLVLESDEPVDLSKDEPDGSATTTTTTTASGGAAKHDDDEANDRLTPDKAKASVEALKKRALAEAGLANATKTASKPTTVSPARDIDKGYGKAATSKELSEEGEAAYRTGGGMAAVDIGAQKSEELRKGIEQYIARYAKNLSDANAKIVEFTASIDELTAMQKQAKAVPADSDKFAEAQKILKEVEKTLADVKVAKSQLSSELIAPIKDLLSQVKAETDLKKRYEKLQPGRADDILKMYKQVEKVYADTSRRLVVLGRLKDTHAWLEGADAKEKGRVLDASNWSISVNDAFMKSGLDQKAEFAMLTKFQDKVKAKVKKLLSEGGTRPVEELITEIREFAKAEADPALWTGKLEHNEGFAVSMRELEQIIRDGYVMQEFDPTGAEFAGEGQGTQQMMIPKGAGFKIKPELEKAAAARATPKDQKAQLADRWKRSQPNFDKGLKTPGMGLLKARQADYEKALAADKLPEASAAMGAIEELIAEHLIRPRQALQQELKNVLTSDGFKQHAKETPVLELVKKVRAAEEGVDFVLERQLLEQLKQATA